MSHITREIEQEQARELQETKRQKEIETFWNDSSIFPTSIKPDDFDKYGRPIWYKK